MPVTTMIRVNAAWQNWPGAPGVSHFYLDGQDLTGLQGRIDAIRTFFNALVAYLPSNLTIQVPSSGDLVETATGTLSGVWSVGTTPAVVTGGSTAAYAGNAGMVTHWLTDGFVAGRRVRGRTFIVPCTSAVFETNGSPTASAITGMKAAADALITSMAGKMLVWARPFVDPAGVKPPRTGSASVVNGSRVPDLAISLRSRRT